MKKIKELTENKIFKIASIVLKVLCYVILVTFVVVIYMQRLSNNKIAFFDFRMFTVISGSMEPKYNISDVLISKEVDPSKIKVGDDISYLGNKGDVRDKIVTHRVNKIVKEDDKYYFHTQGINSLVEDPVVSEEQIYGKIVYKSFILSTIYKIVQTSLGLFLCIFLPIAYIIGSEIIRSMLEKEEKRREKISI